MPCHASPALPCASHRPMGPPIRTHLRTSHRLPFASSQACISSENTALAEEATLVAADVVVALPAFAPALVRAAAAQFANICEGAAARAAVYAMVGAYP